MSVQDLMANEVRSYGAVTKLAAAERETSEVQRGALIPVNNNARASLMIADRAGNMARPAGVGDPLAGRNVTGP
jgi:hypothetical protein